MNNVTDYIPQRPPIVMVDTLHSHEGNVSQTGLTILPDNIFVRNGHLQDSGLTEHIAQSAAMHVGYDNVANNRPVQTGFIGSINKLTINRLPLVGETLRTTITLEAVAGAITLVGASVSIGDELIATTKMKVAMVD